MTYETSYNDVLFPITYLIPYSKVDADGKPSVIQT